MNAETVDLYWFGPSIGDRVITLRPVGVSLCVGLLCCIVSCYRGAHNLSLYIGREGCGAVTILVGSKKRCPELNTKVSFHRNPASLAYSTQIR
jgi:hypothetical protein